MLDEACEYTMTKRRTELWFHRRCIEKGERDEDGIIYVALLALIGIGAAVLYKIGEAIVEMQDATRCGKPTRKEHEDGRTEKSKP